MITILNTPCLRKKNWLTLYSILRAGGVAFPNIQRLKKRASQI